eukprot:TRINITY_DN1215_c0_g1_i2.p1 TRINITY_DN1215_c0_g1~~TRINITY_DN1215_c0_g1_i2.p1  ORF type:complete len:789 (+),score=201.23 TRINITY_DN1215_c0_g1_i2:279-2369(+)
MILDPPDARKSNFAAVLEHEPLGFTDFHDHDVDPIDVSLWTEVEQVLCQGRWEAADSTEQKQSFVIAEHLCQQPGRLSEISFGRAIAVVRQSLTTRKLLGKRRDVIVPFRDSEEHERRLNAAMGMPTGVEVGERYVFSCEGLVACLRFVLAEEAGGNMAISRLKAVFRERLGAELSETALRCMSMAELLNIQEVETAFEIEQTEKGTPMIRARGQSEWPPAVEELQQYFATLKQPVQLAQHAVLANMDRISAVARAASAAASAAVEKAEATLAGGRSGASLSASAEADSSNCRRTSDNATAVAVAPKKTMAWGEVARAASAAASAAVEKAEATLAGGRSGASLSAGAEAGSSSCRRASDNATAVAATPKKKMAWGEAPPLPVSAGKGSSSSGSKSPLPLGIVARSKAQQVSLSKALETHSIVFSPGRLPLRLSDVLDASPQQEPSPQPPQQPYFDADPALVAVATAAAMAAQVPPLPGSRAAGATGGESLLPFGRSWTASAAAMPVMERSRPPTPSLSPRRAERREAAEEAAAVTDDEACFALQDAPLPFTPERTSRSFGHASITPADPGLVRREPAPASPLPPKKLWQATPQPSPSLVPRPRLQKAGSSPPAPSPLPPWCSVQRTFIEVPSARHDASETCDGVASAGVSGGMGAGRGRATWRALSAPPGSPSLMHIYAAGADDTSAERSASGHGA